MPLSLKMFGWKTLELYGIVGEVTDQADGADRRSTLLNIKRLTEVRRRGNYLEPENLPYLAIRHGHLYSFSTDQLTCFSYPHYIHMTYPIVIHILTDYLDMIAL
jgi:hypothetical protein